MSAGRRLLFSDFSLWMLFAAAGVYYISPLFMPGAIVKPIRFGVDLVGGTYISLIVDTDKAVEDTLYERMKALQDELGKAQYAQATNVSVGQGRGTMVFPTAAAAQSAKQYVSNQHLAYKTTQDNNQLFLELPSQERATIERSAVESNINVLENRLNKFAVSEVTVAAQGDRNIMIELPDVEDPERAKEMIGQAAVLEFALVEDEASTQEDLMDKYGGVIPDDLRLVPLKVKRGDEDSRKYFLLQRHVDVTGRLLRNAAPTIDEGGMPAVSFEFSPEGGRKFGELTGPNVGRQLAIVLDNEVISAPRINQKITRGGQITGHFTLAEAKDLSDVLKSGAFAAPVKFDEERTIGPALGAQAIHQGALACMVGLALLLLFSVLYYKIPGLFAFITLLYNLLLLLLTLAWFHGTLTLPGIAGLVLTLGMAIDSSILIYERIKEELRQGVTLGKAIETGFSGALVVILDANITTFIMGVVLYKFGTGPVQGFAITLMIGIVTTLITGLFFLRSLFNMVTKGLGVQSMKF